MEVLHPRCAGLDVHKDTVVACVRLALGKRKIDRQVETFGTTTSELLLLADWLTANEVTHVLMEATGVYWRPVWHILEDHFELVLGNAAHIRNVPGRKTDVADAVWLADLLAHGLVRGSFVPERQIQEVRDLTRTRKQFVRERTRHIQRLQKTLEGANIKLDSVVSDIMGLTGTLIIEALIDGETDPKVLAKLAQGKLCKKKRQLAEALRGHVTSHHRFMLRLHLEHIRSVEQTIATIEAELGEALSPLQEEVQLLMTIPGVGLTAAQAILSEVGSDMGRFPTGGHLVSWAGLCPRNDESAGKRRTNRIRRGAEWLKPIMVQCAWAAVRKKDSYPRAQYQRIRARRGPKKAIIAVAASLLNAIYYVLSRKEPYRDLGGDYFDILNRERQAAKLKRRLENLGYSVEIAVAA